MKEQTQQPGVRKWAGDDMIALQAEPLSAIQGFFKEYGNCIIQGCATTPATGGKFNIAPGLLGLSGMDADGVATFKVVPFSGVEDVTLPLYFTLTHSVVDRVYGDGKVKPIAYDYRAAVSAVRPAAGVEFLELTTAGGRRFVDAVKITEKLDKTGNGRDVTVTFAQAATRENIASGEKLTVILGKIIRWLADLKALAFKDKVSKADMDAALQGELNGKEPGFTKNSAFNKNFGTAAGTVCQGNDARLSDARVASDVSAWAKAASKPNYNFNEINYFSFERLPLNSPQRKKLFYSMSEHGYLSFVAIGANRRGDSWGRGLFSVGTNDAGTTYTDFEFDVNGKIYSPAGTFALTSDIPASLPANGGNADTVNSRGYKQFVYVNSGLNIQANDIGPGSFSGFGYEKNGWPTSGSFISFGGLAAEGKYVTQIQADYGSGNGMFFRTINSDANVANPWRRLALTADIPTTLPAKGGDADTVGGKRASDFLLKSGDQAMQGNLTLDTSNASYVTLKRNNESVAYMGLGSTTKKDIILTLYKSENSIRIDENGKNYSNHKEIATVDQIKALSGGATPTAGQYVSGIAVNDHEITVTKAALPTTDLGGIGANGVNWDTFTTPGANWTNSMGWGTNAPNTNNMNGLLIVSRSGNCIVQCYEPSDATGAFKRVKPIDGYWSDWKQCAMKSDFNTANIAESANKRFMSDAQEAKLDGGLEVAFAGIVDADGGKVKLKGREFDVQKNGYGLFTITHNENDANLIVQVMSEGGQVSVAHSFTSRTFKVDSYAGAGGNTNGRGFRFVAYKL